MALSEDEIDDLLYLARTGDDADLADMLREISSRQDESGGAGLAKAQVLAAARDEGKATCLHMAAANGHSKTVTLILSYLPPSSVSGKTATSESAGDLPASASTSTPASTSTTDSAAATQQSDPDTDIANYINAQNSFGNTALHWACLGGHLDIVRLLLSRGASPAIANDKDQIPLDMAAFNNHMHAVEFFLSQSRDIEGNNAKEGGLSNAANGVEMEDMAEGEAAKDDDRKASDG